MVSVDELLELTLFDDFTLIAGEEGLSNTLNTVAILEYESYQQNYEVFSAGDFILTSLFFAKDNPALIVDAFRSLIALPVSGIAVKTMFFHQVPEEALAIANDAHIPVFLFQNAYMEDLIISANELLKSKLQYLVFEEKITSLIERTPSLYTVSSITHEINYHFKKYLISVYLTPTEFGNRNSLSAYFQRLIYKRFKQQSVPTEYTYVKYRQGMLLLLSFDEPPENLPQYVSEQLTASGILLEHFHIGIADFPQTAGKLDVLVEQSIIANRVSQMRKEPLVLYSACGIYQFIAPLLHENSYQDVFKKRLQVLQEYDKRFTSNLFSTLEVFIDCNGEISKTADRVFQHPNTIRYRLKKICTLWDCSMQELYNYAFLNMHLYKLEHGSIL